MTCPKCKVEQPYNAKFCSECGTPLSSDGRFRNALEWFLYVKSWGGWKRAIAAYLLLVALLGMIWSVALITSDLYAHPGIMWSLVAIAAPASLLILLAASRLLLAIKKPLILLAKFAMKAALLFFGLWIIIYTLPLVFSESPWAYALRYSADLSQVQILPKPADCDFLRAPIGFKGCHYEKSIQVTRYKTDAQSGNTFVSYDDGKTWAAAEAGQKPGSTQVHVGWDRVVDGKPGDTRDVSLTDHETWKPGDLGETWGTSGGTDGTSGDRRDLGGRTSGDRRDVSLANQLKRRGRRFVSRRKPAVRR